MDRDSLADLPADSRREIVAAVCALLDVEAATAEDLVRSAEPLWEAMERAGGLVDSWGGASSATSSRASWRSFGRVRWAADCCRSVRCTASCSDAHKAAVAVGGAGYGRQPHRQRRRDSHAPATDGRSPRPSAPMGT